MPRYSVTFASVILVAGVLGCSRPGNGEAAGTPAAEPSAPPAAERPVQPPTAEPPRADERHRMVETQIADRGVTDPLVLRAMREVPRHEFIPDPQVRDLAYLDRPLPIGHDQTISQPYIVAAMTELARVEPGDKVLEVGTGSGYQAAVLAAVGAEVYSIEIVEWLGTWAAEALERTGYADRVQTRIGDGYAGWAEAAPFDAIVVTAAPPRVPEPLKQQLKVGGRLVIPVGDLDQELRVYTRTEDGLETETVFPVRFVPMTGKAQE
jgi:protein-L-isoaspartate(D-aspartate) O-methyltransferase